MSKLLKTLSEEEINSVSELGKGCPWHALIACGAGYDSGTCSWVFEQCAGRKLSSPQKTCKSGAGCTCQY